MRKRRILSLLLAVAVMATMLIAVPLTASAETTYSSIADKYDFTADATYNAAGSSTDIQNAFIDNAYLVALFSDNATANSDKIIKNFKSAGGSMSGFKQDLLNENKTNGYTNLYIKPKVDGEITVEFQLTGGISSNKSVYLFDNSTGKQETVVTYDNDKLSYNKGTPASFSKSLTKDVEYLIHQNGTGNIGLKSISFEPASKDPSMSLDKEEITLQPSGTAELTATLLNTTAQDNKITWKIDQGGSNKGAISIGDNNDGKTTINIDAAEAQPGDSATIIATVTGSTDFPEPVSKKCTVNVANIPKSITINEKEPYTYVGKETKLTVTVEPADAVYELEWSVDKNATVNNGTVTGSTAGTAKVTVKVKDHEDVTASVDVDVKNIPRVDGVDANNITKFQNNNFKEHAESIVDDLTAATTTRIYDILGEAAKKGYSVSETALNGESPYEDGKLYFDKEVAVVGSSNPIYQNNKDTTNIDGTTQTGGIRVKNRQDVFALKLAAGSTVRVNIHGGGKDRYGIISSTAGNYSKDIGGETLACEDVSSKNALVEYTNNTKAEQVIYIAATDGNEQKPGGDSFISQIQVIVPPEKGVADSGWYGEAENPNGVIRFLQSFDEETVEEMGIYIVDGADGEIVETKKISTEDGGTIAQLAEAGGFYADIYDISKTSDENTTFYAVPFVKLTGGTVIKAETIESKVDWNRQVEYTPGN